MDSTSFWTGSHSRMLSANTMYRFFIYCSSYSPHSDQSYNPRILFLRDRVGRDVSHRNVRHWKYPVQGLIRTAELRKKVELKRTGTKKDRETRVEWQRNYRRQKYSIDHNAEQPNPVRVDRPSALRACQQPGQPFRQTPHAVSTPNSRLTSDHPTNLHWRQ